MTDFLIHTFLSILTVCIITPISFYLGYKRAIKDVNGILEKVYRISIEEVYEK
jgi:hypothetical protein